MTAMIARPPIARYICPRCLSRQQRRRLVSTSPGYLPPPPRSGAAKLTNRRLISLHGEEAPKFLQGLVSNNVRTDSRSGFYAAFLTAPGKVLHDVFIYPTQGSQWHNDVNKDEQHGYLVDLDADQADVLMRHMKKHKLRSKFKLRLLEHEELNVWSAWKEDDRWTAHTQGSLGDGALGLIDCRAPGMGKRLLLPSGSAGSGLPPALETEEAPLEAYQIRRLMRGVPEGQAEIPRDESLPMNYNFDIMGGIDFKKGCYLGQELTIRTHHTGVVRRRILPVALYPYGSPEPVDLQFGDNAELGNVEQGLDIRRDDKRKRPTGKLITSVGNIGLGMCRLEQMTDLVVSGEGSSFGPDDKFLVETSDGGQVGVKAFVPEWMRGKIREPKIQRRVE